MHGTCGLNNPWYHLRKIPGRPPYMITYGGGQDETKEEEDESIIPACSLHCDFVPNEPKPLKLTSLTLP